MKMKIIVFLVKISWEFVPVCPINNKSDLVQEMAWSQTGDDEPVFQPIMP